MKRNAKRSRDPDERAVIAKSQWLRGRSPRTCRLRLAQKQGRRIVTLQCGLALSVCLGGLLHPLAFPAAAQQPPKDLLRRLAAQGSLFEKERESYSYRRSFSFHEMDRHGARTGSYREVREVLFTPEGERIEEFIGPPDSRLRRIQLTEEDFRDLREVQPYVLTKDTLWRYQLVYKGPESVDGVLCYVYRISPRQILEGDRMLDGLIWVSHAEEQIVRVAGRPVPQIHGAEQENLFPQFTTLYEPIDGRFWFPVKTVASDILPFSSGLQRVHYVILYSGYKRFTAESKIVFDRP